MTATLTFNTREQAQKFATQWALKTLTGYSISSGTNNVDVTIWNVTDDLKIWIDGYINKMK